MDGKDLGELKEIERYYKDELQRDTKFVFEHCASGQTLIHREPRTLDDFIELQDKLEDVRRRIRELQASELAGASMT